MAGSSGGDGDDPISVNCVALIDIIFCLCIFFMCSFHFKEIECRIDSWLPQEKGPPKSTKSIRAILDELRVTLEVEPGTGAVVTRLGARRVEQQAELAALLVDSKRELAQAGRGEAPVIVDATPGVPWKAVVGVVDLCHVHKLAPIELASPRPAVYIGPGGR